MSHQLFGSSLVYVFGDDDGKRGLDKNTHSSAEKPLHITFFEILTSNDKEEFETISHDQLHIVDVEMGYRHTILIDNLGRVFGCGDSYRGQAGHAIEEIITPRQIFKLRNEFIKSASCGYYFTLYLTNDGKVFGSGENDFNQIPCFPRGAGRILPVQCPIPEDIKVKSIHCGYYHSIVLDTLGKVYVSGQKSVAFHQLTALKDVFIVNAGAGCDSSFFISKEGDVYGSGSIGIASQPNVNVDIPTKIIGFKHPISSVASGYYHTLFCSTLESGGIVYSCGPCRYNSACRDIEKDENMKENELYQHNHFTNICQINCGGYNSAILNGKEKAVFVFGVVGKQSVTEQPYKVVFKEIEQNVEGNNYISVKAIAGGRTIAVLVHKYESITLMMKKLGNFILEQSKDHLLFDIVTKFN
ncbi:hypothetical protein ABK040_008930 [Willaertia magna]